MGLVIALTLPIVGAFIYINAKDSAKLSNQISSEKLPKTKLLGEMVFKFRNIRLEIRTVPVQGMTWEQIDSQIALTKNAITEFNQTQQTFEPMINSPKERELYNEFKVASDEFLQFGGDLINLSVAHDKVKLSEVARLVRDVCPVKAAKVENAIHNLIEYQGRETGVLNAEAKEKNENVNLDIVLGSIFGFLFSLGLSVFLSRKISKELNCIAEKLVKSSKVISGNANQVSENGKDLASASEDSGTALHVTASAIEEISTMIGRNSESAKKAKEIASKSLQVANQGRKHVDELNNEVQEISNTTQKLLADVANGNKEIGKIINLIKEIDSKTKVINDIVFQTKLLSFNASVEAARAGEAGKGFSVVAEEVGNLATMSGRSAKEISDLLATSITTVQEIVKQIQANVEMQGTLSSKSVARGVELGRLSEESLKEILSGAMEVEEQVNHITAASQEQSLGVREVSNAMSKMDTLTQSNLEVSKSSASAAEKLLLQAHSMNSVISDLYKTIRGSSDANPNATQTEEEPNEMLSSSDHLENTYKQAA